MAHILWRATPHVHTLCAAGPRGMEQVAYAALLAVTLRLEPGRFQAMNGTRGEDVCASRPAHWIGSYVGARNG